MSKFLFIPLFLCALMNACDDVTDGGWDPMSLTDDCVNMNADGGTATISIKNYPSIWLNDIVTDTTGYSSSQLSKSTAYYYHDTQKNNYTAPDSIIAPWVKAVVLKESPQRITITVAPNRSAVNRQARLDIEYGDAFAAVIIRQAGKR